MARGHLDKKLLDKIAHNLGKQRESVNVKVSKRAAKLGISSEAALVLVAKEQDIGTAWYQRKLTPEQQREIRDNLPSLFPSEQRSTTIVRKGKAKTSPLTPRNTLKAAGEYLLQDNELRDRCLDLLLAKSKFDRAINQGTLVLEDRIRTKGQPSEQLVGENLVNFLFKDELSKTVLKISDNADDQRGFTFILRGLVPAFRNITHHHITNKFTREDALRVCAFIDVLLRIVDASIKVR